MGRVAGKVAIVTGGASGMGKADAIALAREGARVVVADLNAEGGQAVADAIGDSATFMRLDVTDEDNWQSVVAATVEKFGRLDILVNNAGTLSRHAFEDLPEDEWDRVMATNAKGYFLCGQQAARMMMRQGSGRIINISSISQSYRGLTGRTTAPRKAR